MTSPLAGIRRSVGKALGGVFHDAVLTRQTTTGTFDPIAGAPVTFRCKALATEFSSGVRGQGLVGATDMKVLILQTTLNTTPEPGDVIAIVAQGFTGTVVPNDAEGTKAIRADPAKALWTCRCAT